MLLVAQLALQAAHLIEQLKTLVSGEVLTRNRAGQHSRADTGPLLYRLFQLRREVLFVDSVALRLPLELVGLLPQVVALLSALGLCRLDLLLQNSDALFVAVLPTSRLRDDFVAPLLQLFALVSHLLSSGEALSLCRLPDCRQLCGYLLQVVRLLLYEARLRE